MFSEPGFLLRICQPFFHSFVTLVLEDLFFLQRDGYTISVRRRSFIGAVGLKKLDEAFCLTVLVESVVSSASSAPIGILYLDFFRKTSESVELHDEARWSFAGVDKVQWPSLRCTGLAAQFSRLRFSLVVQLCFQCCRSA